MAFLHLIKYVDPTTPGHKEVRIFDYLVPHWEQIAGRLGLNDTVILTIKSPGMGKLHSTCLMEVLGKWTANDVNLSNYKQYPATWRGVFNLLSNFSDGALAKKLKEALEAEISTIRQNYQEE